MYQNSKNNSINIFFSYSQQDEDLRDKLESHLSSLARNGLINSWHDRKITAGTEWRGEIDAQINKAQIILLLISADFLASDYCYDIELKKALERDLQGEARVIPIILRPVYWQDAPFKNLEPLPKNGKAVVTWPVMDEAFLDISTGIREAIEELKSKKISQIQSGDRPQGLPRRHPFFVGREKEVSELCKSLEAYEIVQIRGLGGIGKSALAIEVAYRMTGYFKDGLKWFFAPDYDSIELFLNELASLFNINIGQMSLDDKKAVLKQKLSNKKVLIILDNVENSAMVNEILEILSGPSIMITSRPHIPMIRNGFWKNLEVLEEEDATDLFIQVSAFNQPGNEDRRLIFQICEALGFFPLAIELTAKLFRFAKLGLDRIHGDILKITSSKIFENIPEFIDDRKVGASFISTYQILNDVEKQLFDLLGVFPARTFTIDAVCEVAKQIADKDEIERMLHNRLIALSLVNFDQKRYNLHPLLKSFACSHLSSSEPYHLVAKYYTKYAKDNKNNFAALETERANLLGVMDWSYQLKEYELVYEMAEALVGELRYFSYLSLKGYCIEALKRLEQELEAMQVLSKDKTGRVYLNMGHFHYVLGNQDQARNAHQLAEEAFIKDNDIRRLIITYWQAGYIEDDEDNYQKATEYYQKSLDLATEFDPRLILNSRKLVGVVKYHIGDYDGARRDMEHSLKEAIEINNKPDIATCQRRLAAVYRRQAGVAKNPVDRQNLLDKARQLLFDCLEIEQSERSIARAYRQLGMIEQEEGSLEKATNYYERCLDMFVNLGNKKGIASSLYNLGNISEKKGLLDKAQDLYEKSLEISLPLKVKFGVALTLRQLGWIASLKGDKQNAIRKITEAVELLKSINCPFLPETLDMLQSVTRNNGLNTENTQFKDFYDGLWNHSKRSLAANEIQNDHYLRNLSGDRRRGVSLIIRLNTEVTERIEALTNRLKFAEPEQFYYGTGQIHVTVLSIFVATEHFLPYLAKTEEYKAVIRSVLLNTSCFDIVFHGITATPSAVMVQGFTQNEILNQTRDQLRLALYSHGLGQSLDERYRNGAAHTTIVRFQKLLEDPSAFLKELENHRDYPFGTSTCDTMYLVLHDWYLLPEKVEILEEYKLKV